MWIYDSLKKLLGWKNPNDYIEDWFWMISESYHSE
jgi:hypothetical protein